MFRPAFGCTQHPKAGPNTQHSEIIDNINDYINSIQTWLNIDEKELESQTFKETSTQWLGYNRHQQKKIILWIKE